MDLYKKQSEQLEKYINDYQHDRDHNDYIRIEDYDENLHEWERFISEYKRKMIFPRPKPSTIDAFYYISGGIAIVVILVLLFSSSTVTRVLAFIILGIIDLIVFLRDL